MLPAVQIGQRYISMYAVMGVLGISIGTFFAYFRAKKSLDGFDASHVVYLALYGALGAMAGAKLLFLATQAGSILEDVHNYTVNYVLIKYLSAGFVFYGGLPGLAGGMYLYCRYMKISFRTAVELAVPVIPLVHAFGRIGCFFAGCCYGRPWNPPLGIAFSHSISAPNHIHLLPIQLFESAGLLLLFLILWRYSGKGRPVRRTLGLYLYAYAPFRFILEFFRGDGDRGIYFGLSTSQWISLLLVAGISLLLLLREKSPKVRI